MGIIAAAVQVLYIIIGVFGLSWYFDWEVSLSFVVRLLLECVGAVYLGFAFTDKPKAIAAAAPQAPGVTDTYEKLTHLKELFDKGIITQEEFDAKKKDILGS